MALDTVTVVEGHVLQEIILSHSVALSWTASTDVVDGYMVFRGTTAGGESTTALNATVVSAAAYTDATVPGPGVYFYTVKASKGGILSLPSNEVSVTISPAPPSGLTVTSSS